MLLNLEKKKISFKNLKILLIRLVTILNIKNNIKYLLALKKRQNFHFWNK